MVIAKKPSASVQFSTPAHPWAPAPWIVADASWRWIGLAHEIAIMQRGSPAPERPPLAAIQHVFNCLHGECWLEYLSHPTKPLPGSVMGNMIGFRPPAAASASVLFCSGSVARQHFHVPVSGAEQLKTSGARMLRPIISHSGRGIPIGKPSALIVIWQKKGSTSRRASLGL